VSDRLDQLALDDADSLLIQLRELAAAFTEDEADLARVLQTMAADVERARREPLPIFPVIHHSPASAVHMVRWLRERRPKLVFIEMCEDLIDLVPDLKDCTLPVALQAFAGETEGFPPSWTPLSVVAPITEFSAEYQAMAYALQDPDVELVFVDRSVDHVFQWRDRSQDPDTPVHDDEDDEEEARLHGSAVGLELGGLAPSFGAFRDVLLANARMTHFEEWTSLYIEEPTIGSNTATYRAILFLVGSLFRRLGSTPHDREEIRRRDRYMWTRIKDVLADRKVAPEECVFLCGAAHAVADDCPEWGLGSDARFEPEPRTATRWLNGFIPSSYAAIELQFGHARGAVSMAESRWKKALKTWNLQPYTLTTKKGKASKRKVKAAKPPMQLSLDMVLTGAPPLADADVTELLTWVTGIVSAARKNRYLATTADAIAIYETSILLARMRSRKRPSPFDFIDAAETCLEKGRPPGRRSIRQLCNRMLGGDRIGQVGYSSLPPLVQDVYDRLAPLGIDASTRRVTRVLMDFTAEPDKRACSMLLWRLNWLTQGTRVARPIMGELKLGMEPRQESWDVALHGAEQRAVIQLAFEGVTVEQVLEKRLSADAFGVDARTLTALRAVEGSLILLSNPRLSASLGHRAIELLSVELGAEDAADIFATVRRLVAHFRTTADGLPAWLSDFVATGYAHYSTQLPEAFADRGTTPEQLAAMLAFVFTLESLALAMGCARSQLVIAIELAATQTAEPDKLGLLWAAEWLVQLRDEADVRRAFAEVLGHPLGRNAYPRYLSGFLAALSFAPRAAPLGVELLGRAFAELPDRVLLPWMPALLTGLRSRQSDVLPALFKEATRTLPRSLPALDRWTPPWDEEVEASEDAPVPAARTVSETAASARALLGEHPEATDAWARLFGDAPVWGEVGEGSAPAEEPETAGATHPLVARHPEAMEAWARLMTPWPSSR